MDGRLDVDVSIEIGECEMLYFLLCKIEMVLTSELANSSGVRSCPLE